MAQKGRFVLLMFTVALALAAETVVAQVIYASPPPPGVLCTACATCENPCAPPAVPASPPPPTPSPPPPAVPKIECPPPPADLYPYGTAPPPPAPSGSVYPYYPYYNINDSPPLVTALSLAIALPLIALVI